MRGHQGKANENPNERPFHTHWEGKNQRQTQNGCY